ncbi:class A beta-lactamase [Novosphingobium naphthalenivorans]|uniref:class A beta-lactamase n=1 Tax=Novosphingobium naphthalenivorans TaxID=273168 RepID=UPI0008328B6C|nr:class A beta-lactamase [Novosphingobium naphthalenivorans]
MQDRRQLLIAGLNTAIWGAAICGASGRALAAPPRHSPTDALRAIERDAGGRLGVFVHDTASGRSFGWRQNERFTHCSSFKLSLAAMMFAGRDAGTIDLGRVLHWTQADLLPHSPTTTPHVGSGLTVNELARAALIESDNTAANVLLKTFGGPEAVTRFWRTLGDRVSRLDRFEPDLNITPPGTELDTTTPKAMAGTLQTLLTGQHLSVQSRETLKTWMSAVTTGSDRLRAGFPKSWASGDKTGTGRYTYVDLAFGGPAGKPPLYVAAYFEPAVHRPLIDPAATAVLAAVGDVAARHYARKD